MSKEKAHRYAEQYDQSPKGVYYSFISLDVDIIIDLACEPEWIPVDEILPDEQKPILFYFSNGHARIKCFGFYTHGGKLEDSNADSDDDAFFPEGFYEQGYEEDNYYKQEAIAWMYYPELPLKTEKPKEKSTETL